MGEEFARWLDAARPAWPVAVALLAVFAAGAVVTAFLLRRRWIAARAAEKRTAHLWRNINCVVEPTGEIDMRPLMADAKFALIDPQKIIKHLHERRMAAKDLPPPPDWTPEELAAVKAMTDRSGWPNTTYQPRGVLPNLRPRKRTREEVPVEKVTPLQLGERIKRIKSEQKKEKAA